jgi:hypothetical protein
VTPTTSLPGGNTDEAQILSLKKEEVGQANGAGKRKKDSSHEGAEEAPRSWRRRV